MSRKLRLALFALAAFGQEPARAQTTERVSVDSLGTQGNQYCEPPSISADGRFVAFPSLASNLVPNDTNGTWDVFVHDRQMHVMTRVSVDSLGAQANSSSNQSAISADGRFVAFESFASNLVFGDTNGLRDIFVHDRQTGQTTRVSIGSLGTQSNDRCWAPSISADGRFLAFHSAATNLVPADTNAELDVFVHDRVTGFTTRVSVDSLGAQVDLQSTDPSISADGRLVAFQSFATDLVPGDTNRTQDIFVHDRLTGITTRVSVDSLGRQANTESSSSSISADGERVAFVSHAKNLVPGDSNNASDIFVHDRPTGRTSRVSVDSTGAQANGFSGGPSYSAGGRYVAFHSGATNLVPSDTNADHDVFVHDRQTNRTTQVSIDSLGVQGNADSLTPAISADGRWIAFISFATNLVAGDTNGVQDVFVHDRGITNPFLVMSGSCPGTISLTIHDAAGNGTVAIVHGPAGVFVKPTPPCQGVLLEISPPTRGAMRTANAVGIASITFHAPSSICGRSVQAVDVTSCVATNTVVL